MTKYKNIVDKFFQALAAHYSVRVSGNKKWKADLYKKAGKKINVNSNKLIATWIRRKSIPDHDIEVILNLDDLPEDIKKLCALCANPKKRNSKENNSDKDSNNGGITPEPYPEPEENIGIPKDQGRDSRPQLYTEPRDGTFMPQTLFGQPHPDQEYIDTVIEIFDSGERGTIEALKSNIKEFHEKIIERKKAKIERKKAKIERKKAKIEKEQLEFRQRKLEKELENVKKSIASLEAGQCNNSGPENGGINTARSTK